MRERVLQACLLLGNSNTSISISISIKLKSPVVDILQPGVVQERREQQLE